MTDRTTHAATAAVAAARGARCQSALRNMYQQSRRYDAKVEAAVKEAAYEQEEVPHGV